MIITETQLLALLQTWLWPFVRVGALVTAAPIIGTRAVPSRVRLVLALGVTAVLVPGLPVPPPMDVFSAAGVAVTAQQVLIGVILGLSMRLIFAAVELAGQLFGQQMGLGFAAMVDPQSGNQVEVVSQFYALLATLLFLSLNGHLLLLHALADSFQTLPVGAAGITHAGLGVLLEWAGDLFTQAVIIALPAITVLLIVNFAYGILARSAPQLNILAVGFPLTILVGIGVLALALPNLPQHIGELLERALGAAQQILVAR
ncbi:MAG: flagellar biosynthetic protein FliR [Chromatiales bacterium]